MHRPTTYDSSIHAEDLLRTFMDKTTKRTCNFVEVNAPGTRGSSNIGMTTFAISIGFRSEIESGDIFFNASNSDEVIKTVRLAIDWDDVYWLKERTNQHERYKQSRRNREERRRRQG